MTPTDKIKLTPENTLDAELVTLCKSVVAKRARTVIDHILEHGIITNEDLSELYGYDHPPRAIRDVRENGIPLLTHRVTSAKTGRGIGAYTFGDPLNILRGLIGGRKAFSKQFKQALIRVYGERDAFTNEPLDERYLQIDHRVPYQVGGDSDTLEAKDYMLIDASSQRAKSWSCEKCDNFLTILDSSICSKCFWAFPESYTHIALTEKRRLDIVWSGSEVKSFDELIHKCREEGISFQEYITALLRK